MDEELRFNKKFDILLTDYNDDGVEEFLLGQYGSSNFNIYRMYYITKSYEIGYYDEIGELYISDQAISTSLNSDCSYNFYNNVTGKMITKKLDLSLLTIQE